MIPHFMPEGPAVLVENRMRILVVADTHFGAEAELARRGVYIKSGSEGRLERLYNCIDSSDPDLLLLLGDFKQSVPLTTKQEYFELPKIISGLRRRAVIRLTPGNHDGGIERFLEPEEILPKNGVVIDGTGYLHGHTYPDPALLGGLILVGHHHPVAYLYDQVGCSLRAGPAYLLNETDNRQLSLDGSAPEGRTRVLFVPAFFELAGGMDVSCLSKSGPGPFSRAVDPDTAEVFLADGTYLGTVEEIGDGRGIGSY